MLCYRCGSHVADGVQSCGNCGQAFASGGLDKAKLTGSFEVLKRRKGAEAERGRRDQSPAAGVLSAEFAAKRLRNGDLVSGRYEIRALVGRGPAGAVYRALDQEIDDDVALKVIRPDVLESDKDKERFVRVLRKARRLSQQNIVRVYDVEWDQDEDRVFYTSQYLEGLTLRKVLDLRRDRGQHFELREVEPIVSQVCLALQHAHKGAVHGGLKPDNIVILPDLLKLTDFYLAEALGPDTFLRLQDEAELGDYVAPELRAGGSCDAQSDLYSLGAMLTEMLCGAPVLPPGDKPSSLNANLRPAEDELYARATAADPEDRYRNAEEFSEDVTSVIDTGGVLAGEDLGEGAAIAGGAALSLQLEGGTLLDDSDPSTGYTDPHVMIEEIRPVTRPGALLSDDDDTPPGAVLFDDSARRKLAEREGTPGERAKMHRVVPTQEMMNIAGDRPPVDDRDDLPLLPIFMLIAVVVAALAYGAIQLIDHQPKPAGTVVSVPQPVGPGSVTAPAPRAPAAVVTADAKDAGVASSIEPDAGTTEADASAQPDAGVKLASAVLPSSPAGAVVASPGSAAASSAALSQTPLEPLQIPPAPPEPTPAPLPTPAPIAAPSPPPAPVAAPTPTPPPKPVAPPPPKPVPPPPPIQIAAPAPTPPPPPRPVAPPPPTPTPPAAVVAKAQPAAPAAAPEARLSKCPGGMAKIKKGKARIGSSKKDAYRGFEGVEQRVQVDAYCVDRYEYPGKGRAPMTGITHKQAQALCGARKLRLCTDSEWERACKGPRGHRYPYGGTFNADRCVTEDGKEEARSLQPAGAFKKCKSGYGVYDMSGNAAEWSEEGHLRGGTATKPDYAVRCAHKVKKNRAAKDPYVGFRCCADAQ